MYTWTVMTTDVPSWKYQIAEYHTNNNKGLFGPFNLESALEWRYKYRIKHHLETILSNTFI